MGMSEESFRRRETPEPGGRRALDSPPRILLFMEAGRDQELLSDALSQEYQIETTTDTETLSRDFDCCVFDYSEFSRVAGTIQHRRDTKSPEYLPYVLLAGEQEIRGENPEVWEYVDDVVQLPASKQALLTRIKNLVDRRRTAVELANREHQLESTVEDLILKEQAMDEAPVGITIADRGENDNPLVYVNEQFKAVTGYSSDVIGSDCRFLQGEETDEATRKQIREAINQRERVSVDILNYRKNGQKFWNQVQIAPLSDEAGELRNFVGFQMNITDRKIREQRLEVMNRVLSHNLRNKMNVIDGYMALLREHFTGEEAPMEFNRIQEASENLFGLAEAVKKIERTVSSSGAGHTVYALDEQIETILSGFEDRFPEATFTISKSTDEPIDIAVSGLRTALEEAIENAVVHNDSEEPSIQIRISRRDQDWIDIEIEDNGPGIPDQEIQVLRKGETSLDHADRLGLWLIYWVVRKAGGTFDVSNAETGGTIMTLSVPAASVKEERQDEGDN